MKYLKNGQTLLPSISNPAKKSTIKLDQTSLKILEDVSNSAKDISQRESAKKLSSLVWNQDESTLQFDSAERISFGDINQILLSIKNFTTRHNANQKKSVKYISRKVQTYTSEFVLFEALENQYIQDRIKKQTRQFGLKGVPLDHYRIIEMKNPVTTRNYHKYMCLVKECGKIFNKTCNIKNHFASHFKTDFNCDLCGKQYQYSKNLMKHLS